MQLAGLFNLRAADGEVVAGLGGQPITIRADNGAALTVTENEIDALFKRTGEGDQAALTFDVSGGGMSVHGSVDAETTDTGWFIFAPIRLGDYRAERISFDDASAIVRVSSYLVVSVSRPTGSNDRSPSCAAACSPNCWSIGMF